MGTIIGLVSEKTQKTNEWFDPRVLAQKVPENSAELWVSSPSTGETAQPPADWLTLGRVKFGFYTPKVG